MSTDLEGWFNLPKPVKLLDISLIGYIVILVVAAILYLAILDQNVQNLMPIFLAAILSLVTWNFRTQLLKTPDPEMHKRYFREWVVVCICIIVIIGVILLVYPVTY
jgi:predicted PurR-regulated permease PerM